MTRIIENNITIEWRAPSNTGGSKICNYHVYAMIKDSNEWIQTQTLDAFKLTTEIKNLKWDVNYTIGITAENDIDESEKGVSEPVDIERPRGQ